MRAIDPAMVRPGARADVGVASRRPAVRACVVLAALLLLALAPASWAHPRLQPPVSGSYGATAGETQTIFAGRYASSPVVVLVHGGGWRKQPESVEKGFEAYSLQARGMAVFDINYPQDTPTESAFPKEVAAVEEAVRWAKAHATSYNGNPKNVILLGGSAGGHLSEMAAAQLNAAVPGTVAGTISLSGPSNLVSLLDMAQRTELKQSLSVSVGQALGCPSELEGCSQSFAAQWSPTAHVHHGSCAPTLLFSAEVDMVPLSQQREMVSADQAAGCSVSLEVVPGNGHAFSYWGEVKAQILAFLETH